MTTIAHLFDGELLARSQSIFYRGATDQTRFRFGGVASSNWTGRFCSKRVNKGQAIRACPALTIVAGPVGDDKLEVVRCGAIIHHFRQNALDGLFIFNAICIF